MYPTHRLSCLPLLLCVFVASAALVSTQFLSPSLVYAEELVQFNISTTVGAGEDAYFKLTSPETLNDLDITITRPKGTPLKFSTKTLPKGETAALTWKEAEGVFNYQVHIKANASNGQTIDGTQTFSVVFASGLSIQVSKSRVDLTGGQVYFSANQPIARAEVRVYTEGDRLVAENTHQYQGKSKEYLVSWTPTADSIKLVEIKAFDKQDSWAAYKLMPFTVEIPHIDVVFGSGLDTIEEAERPKLDEALKVIFEEMAKYGADFEFSLQIGGYTDTVGSPEDNKTLSEKRAKAIARYFRDHGIKVPIYYKGFGEDSQAVTTADNTPEPRNRRATYNLGDLSPAGAGWKALK